MEVGKIRFTIIIFTTLVLLLSGCMEEKTTRDKPANVIEDPKGYTIQNAKPNHFTVGEQKFQIVPILEPYMDYIEKLEAKPEANHKELYISTVIEPFRKLAFGENEGLRLKDHYSFATPFNVERLKESVKILDENYENINQQIKTSLEKSAKLLPGKDSTIYLLPFNPDQSAFISQMNGVTAFATTNQFIILHLAPQKYNEEMLSYTLAHEYHHTVYFDKNKTGERDLFEYVLSEGKADSFANMVIPNLQIPWTTEISAEVEQTIWKWVSDKRFSFTENDLAELRNGSRAIPQWSDYRIGYQIMQQYLKKNPDVPISEWTILGPDVILQKSQFAGIEN